MTGPWNLTESQRRQLRESQAAAKARPPSKPCPVCGCDPNDAWGCECTNPDCPCSEPEDGEDASSYPSPQGEQALRDLDY